MSERTPFIPSKLDDAALTPHQFRVFCRVSRRGKCTESVPGMADSLGMHKDTVRAALKTLAEAQMIERTPRPGTTTLHRERPPEEWDLTALEETDPCENEGGVGDGDPSPKTGDQGCEKEGDPKNHPPENEGGDPCDNQGGDPCENEGGASKGTPFEGTPSKGSSPAAAAGAQGREPWWFLPRSDLEAYEQTIAESAEQYDASSLDQLVRRYWGGYRQGRLPFPDIVSGLNRLQNEHGDEEGFRRMVAAVVISGGEADSPGVKMLNGVLRKFYDTKSEADEQRRNDSRRESAPQFGGGSGGDGRDGAPADRGGAW